jgi:hypothetical protein
MDYLLQAAWQWHGLTATAIRQLSSTSHMTPLNDKITGSVASNLNDALTAPPAS